MKKRNLKTLQLNKNSISNLKVTDSLKGGLVAPTVINETCKNRCSYSCDALHCSGQSYVMGGCY